MIRVVFVCTGNTCRSPMAESIARRVFASRDDIEWSSAGLNANAGDSAAEHAQQLEVQAGGDLSSHRASPLDHDLVHAADLILTMTSRHRDLTRAMCTGRTDSILTLAEAAQVPSATDVDDPFGGSLGLYETTHRQIESMIGALRPRLNDLLGVSSRDLEG